jgi:hypothetical protein
LFTIMIAHADETLVCDATGKPIAGATLKVQWDTHDNWSRMLIDEGEEFTADEDGKVDLPITVNGRSRNGVARIAHADYGTAQVPIGWGSDRGKLIAPLVKRNSPAWERAVKGVVQDPGGKAVAGALVICSSARTPGEGLIQSGTNVVVTDDAGRFSMYLPDTNPRAERGKLVPPGTKFGLTIQSLKDDSLFPITGSYPNTTEATIALPRPTKSYVFKFKARDDSIIDEQTVQTTGLIFYRASKQSGSITLPQRLLTGGKLMPGIYQARVGTTEYQPVTIDDNTPAEVTFAPIVIPGYTGRVIDGITGRPVRGAFVIAETSRAETNLAKLEPDDWKKLHELGTAPSLDDPLLKPIHEAYGLAAVARTDEQGRYTLKSAGDEKVYSILAFDQDRLPISRRVLPVAPDRSEQVNVADLELFPAARVTVMADLKGKDISISPHWRLAKANQPEWIAQFRAANGNGDMNRPEFDYDGWLRTGQPTAVFVPAPVRLHVHFSTPYNDEWSIPADSPEMCMNPGETLDLGELILEPSLKVTVLVVNEQDKPVEGVPVRRFYEGTAGTVAHNTDAKGLAQFYLIPESRGRFRIVDFPKRPKQLPSADFEAGKTASDKPIVTIKLTQEQVDALLKKPR